MKLESKYLLIGLLALTVVASGCLNGVEDYDEEMPEEPAEPDYDNGEDTSDEETTEEEETEVEETEENETEVREVEIEGGSHYFDPEEVEVEEGETVEFVFVNQEGSHDLVLEDSDGNDVERTEVINGGETDSFTYTFEEDDDYEFYCSVSAHREQGMEGSITVS